MKTSTVFWGTFLISLGISFIAIQQYWIRIEWSVIRDYWSVLLIICGIAVLVKTTKVRWVVSAVVAALLGLAIATTSSQDCNISINDKEWHILDDKDFDFDESSSDDCDDDEQPRTDTITESRTTPPTPDTVPNGSPDTSITGKRAKKQQAIY